MFSNAEGPFVATGEIEAVRFTMSANPLKLFRVMSEETGGPGGIVKEAGLAAIV